MKLIFILGRNPKLSREEILAYSRANNFNVKEIFFEENFLLLESNKQFDIQQLGGTIKLGEVEFEGNQKDFAKFTDGNELVPADKFSYTVLGNGDEEIIKDKFKTDRKKAMLKHGHKKLKFQEGDEVTLANVDFTIFFHENNNIIYFGKIIQEYDAAELKKRDMQKPIRREELAISPRLSKILINLSESKQGQLLLDPFCGIGSILIEALVKNINVFGIDVDKQAIIDAQQNINWLSQNYAIANYTLKNLDSAKAPNLQFDAIATETPLGEILHKKADAAHAKKIIENFQKRIIPILQQLKKCKKQNAKIAITFPIIGNFKPDLDKICEITGLNISMPPIIESRPHQYISREILVLA